MSMPGFLILSHVGFSFVEALADEIKSSDQHVFILSSKPEVHHAGRVAALNLLATRANVTERHELTWADVQQTIDDISQQGYKLNGCICVWEGYRRLMAQANHYLGVDDLLPQTIELLTNKLALRQLLQANQLTSVIAEPLTAELLTRYQHENAKKFIKPVTGIASFGTFRLTQSLAWSTLEALQEDFKQDTVFNSIFKPDFPFMVEDFISGVEVSFELIMEQGVLHPIAIHEKVDVAHESLTTLENACASPPVNLHQEEIDAGITWLNQLFELLGITTGCFHLEARCDDGHWELIEINPRVGGALISQSVEYLTKGHSMLNLWIGLLNQSNHYRSEYSTLLDELSVTGRHPVRRDRASFFRVYFGHKGTIAAIDESQDGTVPVVAQLFAKAGDTFDSDARENFIGQVLWPLDPDNLQASYSRINEESEQYLSISYVNDQVAESTRLSSEQSLKSMANALLIIDFNLSRRGDVAHIREYCAREHGLKTVLIRPNPTAEDKQLADLVIDLDPLVEGFVDDAKRAVETLPFSLIAGLVFSDNAVHTGALLLDALDIGNDCHTLAENAFCKLKYRVAEQCCKPYLSAQQIFVPNVEEIDSVASLADFIATNPQGVVIKPTTEGNNRGVILIEDTSQADVPALLDEVKDYLANGMIAEQMIPFSNEYSYDGIGSADFITEKFNASGRYPVEIAQLVPADVTPQQAELIRNTGKLANLIVGQNNGPFHNEIRINDEFTQAAVVEANRRPAGMKIWSLASLVFQQDLYGLWVDTAIKRARLLEPFTPHGSAMTIMLPPTEQGCWPQLVNNLDILFEGLQQHLNVHYPQSDGHLNWINIEQIASVEQHINVPARDNGDFLALAVVSSDWPAAEMKLWLSKIQSSWYQVVDRFLARDVETVA